MDYLQYFDRISLKKFKFTVLNLVINGLPSILKGDKNICLYNWFGVLNLVINGLPSIL